MSLKLPLLAPADDPGSQSLPDVRAVNSWDDDPTLKRDSFINTLPPEQQHIARKGRSLVRNIALAAVTIAFVVAIFVKSQVLKGGLCLTAIALVWVTETFPLPLAGIFPIFLYSFTNIIKAKAIAKKFWNSMSFLFCVGFLMGAVVERWDLHRRLAVHIVLSAGQSAAKLLFMLMIALWIMSMWLNNAAALLCMLPVIKQFLGTISDEHKGFKGAVLLACAWSSSIGGMATITGSLTNATGMGLFENMFGEEMPFGSFMLCALPLAFVNLFATWVLVCSKHLWFSGKGEIQVDLSAFRKMKEDLGSMKREERIVSVYLVLLISVWCVTGPIKKALGLPFVETSSIGMLFTLPLFCIPASTQKIETIDGKPVAAENVLDWYYARTRFRWEILFIFGGGYMVAEGTMVSGFANWVAGQFGQMDEFVLVSCVIIAACFVTEFISNMACINIFAPIIVEIANTMGYDPLKFLFIVTLASSFAFMLPMASGPNMIAYGTGKDFNLMFMAKHGFALNIIAILIGMFYLNYVLPALLPTGYTYNPNWAVVGKKL
jgi:solute carrier family 13 (sodium-dependent dicarboxylate transporter), member 2/3/5